jgi:hypothetical protein
MARVRPARNGPTLRHRSALSKPASVTDGQSAVMTPRVASPLAIDRIVLMTKGQSSAAS